MSAFRRDELTQLLFMRLRDNRWSRSLEKTLLESVPGGVLFAEPLPRSMEATQEFVRKVARSTPSVPFIAVREEGGPHDPLARFLPALPSPRVVAEKGLSAVTLLGELIGEALGLVGLNTYFAPLLDLATPLSEKRLGARAFGSDPQRVTVCGGAFLRGLARHKILACGKHFPGWGSVPHDDAKGLPVSGKSMAALWSDDLVPYRKLLPQLPMVLMSNAAYKAYDFDLPRAASLSAPVITGLLRAKLGYRGVAMACDLDSLEVRGAVEFGEAAIQSLVAGCDMILADQGESYLAARRAIEGAVDSGKLTTRRATEALGRIRAARKRMLKPSVKFSQAAAERLRRRFESFAKEFARKESNHA